MPRSIYKITLTGGRLCFNFINTVYSRLEQPMEEYLTSYEDLLVWCKKADKLDEHRIKILRNTMETHADLAAVNLQELIAIREMLYNLFLPITNGKLPSEPIQEKFNHHLKEALIRMRLHVTADSTHIQFDSDPISLKEPAWPILKSAFDVLKKHEFSRIKTCGGCGWIFFDESKNNSRKWCDMQACGSQAKMRRYNKRKQQKQNNDD